MTTTERLHSLANVLFNSPNDVTMRLTRVLWGGGTKRCGFGRKHTVASIQQPRHPKLGFKPENFVQQFSLGLRSTCKMSVD